MNVGLLAAHRDILIRVRGIKNPLTEGEMTIDDSFIVETRNGDGSNLLIIPLMTIRIIS